MKNRNNAMFQAMQKSNGTPVDGQQMFEMLSAVTHTVNQLQKIVGGMLEIQNRHNDSIVTLSDNLKLVANQVANLKKQANQ